MRISGFEDNSVNTGIGETRPGAANSMTTSRNSSIQSASGWSGDGDRAQLSRLSSVLNGLENGASLMRQQVQQAMGAVRSGTYQIDPMQLSRRIVGEALGSN